jgi:P-type E1-E2 ATPase
VVVDKTGTLTEGQLQLLSGPRDQRLTWAASLENPCQHPLARALTQSCDQPLLTVEDWQLIPGQGVEGTIEGRRLRLGRAAYLQRPELDQEALHTSVWLEADGEVVARFEFGDRLRPEATEFIQLLRNQGLKLCLASGDRQPVVAEVARQLGIDDYRAQCLPLDKLQWVEELQQQGGVVAFLGDGINDAPALRKANLGITVANGSELSWEMANLVLLRPGLAPAVLALDLARQAWTRLQVNLLLALAYNALAIPAAALGWVTPLTAAVAMPLSSLLVVGQSLLLLGYRPKETNRGRTLLSDSGGSAALGLRPGPLLVGGITRTV